jgi:hypothetical protein
MGRSFFLNLAALMALAAPGEARIVRIAVPR